jgi:tetratricopeptide (TPR) repeat protein
MRICLSVILLMFALDIAIAKDPSKFCYDYVAREQYDRAMPYCTEALHNEGRNVNLALTYINRGRIFFAKGQYAQAIADYNRAIRLGANDNYIAAIAYYCRGSSYQANKQFDRAIADYNKVIDLNPRYYKAYNNLGIIYSFKQQNNTAIALYSEAIKLFPRETALYYNRGTIYALIGKYNEAENDFNMVLELDPSFSKAMYNMACLFALRKDINESCKWLKRSIKNGYNNWNYIRQDNTLDNIRGSLCYEEIMSNK